MSEMNNAEKISLKEILLKLRRIFRYLFSKWYIVLSAGVIGGVLGYFYSYTKDPLYTATTTFVLENGDQGSNIGQIAGLAALAGVDISGGSNNLFQGDNLFALYKSRAMLEKALLSPNPLDTTELLIDQYIRFNKLENVGGQNQNKAKIDFKNDPSLFDRILLRKRDSLLRMYTQDIANNNLTIDKADKKSTIIKVEVKSKNEDFSKSFNEVLVNSVNEFYIKTKTKKSLDNIAILQHKTDSVRAVLNGSISSGAIAIDATPNLNPTRQAQRTIPIQRSQFSAETNRAILGQLVQNLELSKMNLMKESPLIEKIDEPIYPLVVIKLGKIKGFVVGSILFAFFTLTFLSVRKFLLQVLR
jgi:Chain length determinant protein.